MNQVTPEFIRFFERAFSINFVAFSFVMFSCWFPTGFSATFSILAFVFAIPVCLCNMPTLNLNTYEKVGLVLYGWLFLSIFWSDVHVFEGLGYLSEYRIYFMLPLFSWALSFLPRARSLAFVAAMSGALIALISSYGLSWGWLQREGAELSLANRIYHGFIMSSFMLICLLVARERSGVESKLAFIVGLLVAYNVLFIETGRTGYLQVLAVCGVMVALSFSKLVTATMLFAMATFCGLAYTTSESFNSTINKTLEKVETYVVAEEVNSSEGFRIESYRGAIQIGLESPFSGAGVGGVTTALEAKAASGGMRVLTDNVHSEFLNMLIAGGIPALITFAAFIAAIARSGFVIRSKNRFLGDAFIGISVVILISALFNSTIKDYGEKHALMIILAILGSHLQASKRTSVYSVFR